MKHTFYYSDPEKTKATEHPSIIHYSVLHYFPDAKSENNVAIGLAVLYPVKKYVHFFTGKKSEEKANQIDSEFNPEFYNMVTTSLKYQLSSESLKEFMKSTTGKIADNIAELSFMEQNTQYLANEFRFAPITSEIIPEVKVNSRINELRSEILSENIIENSGNNNSNNSANTSEKLEIDDFPHIDIPPENIPSEIPEM